jgi:hypothetical protein
VAGNTSNTSGQVFVSIDTTVAPPSIPDLATGSDSGVSSSDNITNDATPTFTGTAEANATVELFDGATPLGATTASGVGNWTFTSAVLSGGGHAIKGRATDVAGNVSSFSTILDVTIDTTAPQVTGVTISGSGSTHDDYDVPDGSGDQIKTVPVGGADEISITFSEDVGAGVEKTRQLRRQLGHLPRCFRQTRWC